MLKTTLLPLLAVSVATFAFAWPYQAKAGSETQRLSGPYTHDNLTIYFVHGRSAGGPVPLTLEEALDKGTVTVHETGSVGQLAIENTGKDEVLIHAGDIVKGGQQDRVLTTTMVLKPNSGKVPLDAFCVEQGRWSARGKEDAKRFASSKEMMPSREAKLAMKAKSRAEPAVSAGIDREVLSDNADPSTANIAQPRVQVGPGRPAGGVNPQGEVWKNVAGIQAALSANLGAKVNSETSESSLQLALENEKVNAARKAYLDALQPTIEKESDIVGYVFAVNGRINSADVYSSNALFRKLWPRLIKASATEALGAKSADAKTEAPAAEAVELFLTAAASGNSTEHEPAIGMTLKVRDSDKAVDFETLGADGALVHRNVLAY